MERIPVSQLWSRMILVALGGATFFFAQEMESWLFAQKNLALGIGVVVFSAVSLSYLIIATRNVAPRWTNGYVLASALVVLSFYSLVQLLVLPYLCDTAAVTHFAAEQLVQGKNPYVTFDMQEALNRFNLGPEYATLLEDGSLANRLNYPAGSFLLLAPFIAMGLADTRVVYLLCLLAMTLIVHYHAEPKMKNFVVLYVMANLAMQRFTYGGLPEPLWALPTLIAWIAVSRRWSSPLALGLATAIKQLAWFYVPFYLIMTFREFGLRESLRRAGLALGVFAIINLPFIVLSPVEWINGVLGPMTDPLIPMGGGLVALSTSGVLPVLPKAAYTAIEAAVLLASLGWYLRYYSSYKLAGVVLPSLPLWFAWRSLLSYFYMGSFLLLGVAVRQRHDSIREMELESQKTSVGVTRRLAVEVE